MKKLLTTICIILILVNLIGCLYTPQPDNRDLTVFTEGVDVTEKFTNINNDSEKKIKKDFKQGHVTFQNETLNASVLDTGFEIQLGVTNIPSPVVYNGIIYVSGGFGSKEYHAFNAVTGKNIWSISLDDDGPSSAAIVDDVIVFNTESCTIFACKISTGEQVWSYWLGDPLMSMPTIANGIVFTAYPSAHGPDSSHVMIAIELHTGKILWQKYIDADIMSAPVADGDDLFVVTFTGTLFQFRQKTGEIVTAKSIRATSIPVFYNNQIFISKRSDTEGDNVAESLANFNRDGMHQIKEYNKKNAPYLDKNIQEKSKLKESSTILDAGNGFSGGAPETSGWKKANENIGQSNVSSLQSFQGSRTLTYNGRTYNTMGDELVCTDISNSKEKWKYKLEGDLKTAGGFLGTPPLVAGNKIVIAGYLGDITVHNCDTGEIIQKFTVKEPIRYQPVVQNGWIYVTTVSGKLIALNTKETELTGWPMWGANSARTNKPKK